MRIGIREGLKKECSIHCDELVSLPKMKMTNYVGHLRGDSLEELNQALAVALDLDEQLIPAQDSPLRYN
jgi:mRNA interferase MazF